MKTIPCLALLPRCIASVPSAKRLHDAARAAGAIVYYTSTPQDFIDPSFCVEGRRMSSEDPYMEQYAAWHMYKGGPNVVTAATTLTRSTMIKF